MELKERNEELRKECSELRAKMRTMSRRFDAMSRHLDSLPCAIEKTGHVPVMTSAHVEKRGLRLMTLMELAGDTNVYKRIYRRLHKYGIARRECGIWVLREDVQLRDFAVYVARVEGNRVCLELMWTPKGIEYLGCLLLDDNIKK